MKITSLFSLRELLSLEIGHRLVPERLDDCYLVSYPRSGNTWMRTMLGIVLNPAGDGNPDITRSLIPGVSISNASKINQLDSPRLIKSHSWYRPSIKRAIYLVRDGRDVVISLYHYFITRSGREVTFEEFFRAYFQGRYGQLWHQNVLSWFNSGKKRLKDDLLIIRFENLKTDTFGVLQSAAAFLNLAADDQVLQQALEQSRIGRMRKIEIERRGPIDNQDASFYRGGKTGEWKDYFSPELADIFLEKTGKAFQVAGYEV